MGTVGRTFDARQKIGAGDVRQRLGSSGQSGAGLGLWLCALFGGGLDVLQLM